LTLSPEKGEPEPSARGIDRAVARYVLIGLATLIVMGAIAFSALRKQAAPPPREIAGDPLLVDGFVVYRERCVSCHGASGRGDGPIAKALAGPKVGDLTDATWKHGDEPAKVREVISKGVADSAMPGWGGTFSPDQIRAVTAYVYHLAGRHVPAELRTP
jgi:mono/diheme cytochrome c family protein